MAANQLFARTLVTFVAATFFALLCSSPQEVQAMNYTFMKDATRAPNVSNYDYIIVGGGTAGCPLAATLSERGGSPYDDERIGDRTRFADTLSDTSPGSPAQRFVSDNSRQRVLGGGSCINAGFYTRDGDDYVRDAGWDLDATRSAYRWVEDVVAFQPEMGTWQAALQSGLLESGIALENGFMFDHIDGTKVGGSIFDADGRRHTAADLLRVIDGSTFNASPGTNPQATVIMLDSVRVPAFERSTEAAAGRQMFAYMWLSSVAAFAALAFLLLYAVHRWRNPCCSGCLPPGSMGLPLVGETLHFFSPDDDDSFDVPRFVRLRLARYGPIFKTSLVGHPVVVSADEELNHLVFQQEGQLFQSWYPDSFVKILGKDNVGEQQGAMFKYLKNMVLRYFGPESLRESTMLRDVEHAVISSLCTWSTLPAVELKEAVSTMVFDLSTNKLLGLEPSRSKVLRKSFFDFVRGLISFPLYLPGTAYYSCMKGRQSAMEVLHEALEERKRSVQVLGGEGGDERARWRHGDFLDCVVQEITREKPLVTDRMALDLMFVLLFASFHTTSLALTLAVKLLADHPHVLEELTVEHEMILNDRKPGREYDEITWREYKSMTFTNQVINETVRLANIAPGIFRKALKDIQFKGYTIPAGWGVMVCPPAVHLNPDIYPDPLTFNPSRFKDKPEINRGSRHFMAFGGGLRFCVGADFSKLQMSIFLHFLTTRYRWKKLGGGKIVRTPGLEFSGGYHIEIRQRN